MMTKLIHGLLVIAIILSVRVATATPAPEKDDLIPWPWGTECPFPWEKIEGQWFTRHKDHPERFTFEVKKTDEYGSRILEIRRYNEDEKLIGLGEAVSAKYEKIVYAQMVSVGTDEERRYLAIIRTYVEAQKRSCARGKQVTVITLRDSDGSENHDTHVIIDKGQSSGRKTPY